MSKLEKDGLIMQITKIGNEYHASVSDETGIIWFGNVPEGTEVIDVYNMYVAQKST